MSEEHEIYNAEGDAINELEPVIQEFAALFAGNQGDPGATSYSHVAAAFIAVNEDVPEPVVTALRLLNAKPMNAREVADAIYEWQGVSAFLGIVYARADRMLEKLYWTAMPEKGTDKDKQALAKATISPYAAIRDILKFLFLQSIKSRTEYQSLLKLEREEFNQSG